MDFLSFLDTYSDWGLFFLRVVIAVIFIVHGKMKWSLWKMQPSEQLPAGMLYILRFLSIAEPLGAIAVLFGFFTQFAALGLMVVMAGALVTKIKSGAPFMGQTTTGWELDLILAAALFVLIFSGGGIISLDWFWRPISV